MRFLKALRDRRGIALESAIIFMMVIFTLTALLTGLTLLGHLQVSLEKTTLMNDVKLESIGLDFVAYLESGDAVSPDEGEGFDSESYREQGFACFVGEAENGAYSLTVFSYTEEDGNGTVGIPLLYVEALVESTPDAEGENVRDVRILSWRYSDIPSLSPEESGN